MSGSALIAKYGISRDGHSHFAPSSSAGWLNCSGYLLANAPLADVAGIDAAYGTVAHKIAELWREGGRPQYLVGSAMKAGGFTIVVDNVMLDYVQQFVEWCDEVPGDAYTEQRVDLSEYFPIPTAGTADHFVCGNHTLTITDLKMGTGVKVFVEQNPQAMLYALGAFIEWDWAYGFQRIVIRICQPRLGYFGVWECSRDELLAFGEYVRERAALAWQEDAPRTPGEKQCRFCRAKVDCPALALHLDQLVDDTFDDLLTEYSGAEMAEVSDVPARPNADVKGLSIEALAYRLSFRKLYEKWFGAIYAELLDRIQRGQAVKGWKLGNGRRSFAWKNQDDAAALLIEAGLDDEQVWVTEITSVSNAKKTLQARLGLKPKQIEGLLSDTLTVTPGRVALVEASDEREDASDGVDDAFSMEDDDTL